MSKKHRVVGLLSTALLLGLTPVVSFAAPTQASGTVVAHGLSNPRGISMGQDGNLYVAEAGSGGTTQITAPDGSKQMVGPSSKITRVSMDGTMTTVVGGLISGSSEEGETVGAEGVVFANNSYWITGLYVDSTTHAPTFGVQKADAATGTAAPFADLAAYEAANNPDGTIVDSDPYGIAWGADDQLYVADAAGNDLLKVDPSSAKITTVTTFDGIPLPAAFQQPGGNPDRGGKQETDPVPTGLAVAPDGTMYVGLLTGFPFATGSAKVYKVGSGGQKTVAGSGLTMVVGTAVGPDGNVYASEFAKFDATSNPPNYVPNSGAVVRIMPGGSTQVVASGLNLPNGIAFDAAGNLYVAVNSSSPKAGDGEIMRFDGVASGGAMPGMPSTGSPMQPLDAVYVALLLLTAGAAIRTVQARRAAVR